MNYPKNLIKGNVRAGERLARHTSFRIGGPARLWAEPKDASELKKIIVFAGKGNIPVFVIGGGTNVLASDSGFDGIMLHLGAPYFRKITVRGTTIKAGAGYAVSALVTLCCGKGLCGLESLVGIPGTVGGAVYMNAGGWASPLFRNIGDYVTSVKVMDYEGNIKVLKKDEIKFGYRRSNLSSSIILEATLKLGREDSSTLTSRRFKFLKMKKEKQVLDMPSAGCVFKNPDNFQFTTGQLIDMLGLKGLRMGGAEVSRKHANFIINKNSASSDDVLKLIEVIKKKVMKNYGIALELEIKVI